MHQPYYKNLLTGEAELPWVRLHGTKDYLDMVRILDGYPKIRQTFNLVPSLLEQIEDYLNGTIKDKFLELSYKSAASLNAEDRLFIRENFFSINRERVISLFPRYLELYFKNLTRKDFLAQDYLDLQVFFNLAWLDPVFRNESAQIKKLILKGRFFTEEEKRQVCNEHLKILGRIIPAYKKYQDSGAIEVTVSPFYHPILPLLFNTNTAKEANPRTVLPKVKFAYPEDCREQIAEAVKFYQESFAKPPSGMWPSEESVSEHILPYLIEAGLNWIVTDEAILFKSLRRKKRDTELLYQPHLLKREGGSLNIVFRDRNLSDLIGFVYYNQKAETAVADFMRHLQNIDRSFKGEDVLVTIAMDGENAWEYYPNDGHDFLNELYQRLSDSDFVRTTTVSDYLKTHPPKFDIKHLATGSWIYAEFGKWIGNPDKVKAWEVLAKARKDFEEARSGLSPEKLALARKQMLILEGSDWFWWAGEDPQDTFGRLFRAHLANLYTIIGKDLS